MKTLQYSDVQNSFLLNVSQCGAKVTEVIGNVHCQLFHGPHLHSKKPSAMVGSHQPWCHKCILIRKLTYWALTIQHSLTTTCTSFTVEPDLHSGPNYTRERPVSCLYLRRLQRYRDNEILLTQQNRLTNMCQNSHNHFYGSPHYMSVEHVLACWLTHTYTYPHTLTDTCWEQYQLLLLTITTTIMITIRVVVAVAVAAT